MTQTVLKEAEKLVKLKYHNELFDKDIWFEIMGQNVDRSYEDRSVFLTITKDGIQIQDWLNGEDAIELGKTLIEQGTFALKANMINHQLIHQSNRLKSFIEDDRIWILKFTVVDDNPVNYGRGFKTFLIKPIWRRGMAPKYESDFQFEQVIYFSPYKDKFVEQVQRITQKKCCAVFENYDRETIVKEFNKAREEINNKHDHIKPQEKWTI